jgi:transcriptional regulator with XRE-family HTH domain
MLRHEKFAQKLRGVRQDRGWSQEELAEKSGLHRTYVSGLENGTRNPTLSVLIRLATALAVTVGELVD